MKKNDGKLNETKTDICQKKNLANLCLLKKLPNLPKKIQESNFLLGLTNLFTNFGPVNVIHLVNFCSDSQEVSC